jgi:peptidoglycan-N-acetylglucosamine deacetylase
LWIQLEHAELTRPLYSSVKQVAVTLDDLPFARYFEVSLIDQRRIMTKFLSVLERHGICSLGFAVGSWVASPQEEALLDAFVARGHLVGNHSYMHSSFGEMTIEQFEADLLRAHETISRWVQGRYFYRFPYLRLGPSADRKVQAYRVLQKHCYNYVPVTIDLEDWRMDAEYNAALAVGDERRATAIGRQYIDYLMERAKFFEDLARRKLGRSPQHLLLLHLNRLNADTLEEFFDRSRSEGWHFIHPEEALADPMYVLPSRYDGEIGVSWLYHI